MVVPRGPFKSLNLEENFTLNFRRWQRWYDELSFFGHSILRAHLKIIILSSPATSGLVYYSETSANFFFMIYLSIIYVFFSLNLSGVSIQNKSSFYYFKSRWSLNHKQSVIPFFLNIEKIGSSKSKSSNKKKMLNHLFKN